VSEKSAPFWATVCKTVRPVLSDRCLSCLSVCLSVMLVYCAQTVGRIKMKLGMPVGLVPGHIVLNGDPASPLPKGHIPPIFSQYLLWPNGCMDQDAASYGGRPRPRQLCVRWGPCSPPQNVGGAPKFSSRVYCGQMAGWIKMVLGMEVGLSPGDFVLDGHPAPMPKRGLSPSPIFQPISIVAKRLDASRCHLVWMCSTFQTCILNLH